MSSTFSGLGTALSSLIAQRQALDVAGQNIANANTVGYTRQRVNLTAMGGTAAPSLFSTPSGTGEGVRVQGVQRLNDAFLDTRVRTQTATASYSGIRAEAYNRLEKGIGEPSKNGLASGLDELWSAWHDVANTPDTESSRQVLLEQSNAVASQLHTLYDNVQVQWTQTYTSTKSMVEQVNTTAAGVADLNQRILSITNAGGNANELRDARDVLITSLADLAGATVRFTDNGSADVMVSGNLLVSGDRAHNLAVVGADTFAAATGDTSTPGVPVSIVWAENPTINASMSGGKLAGNLTILAPVNANGTGGILTEAAKQLDNVATLLATKVNAAHAGGIDLDGNPGTPFFTFNAGQPPAMGIRVAITDPRLVAAADATKGSLDGSVADAIGKLADDKVGPSAIFQSFVVQLGVRTASETQRSTVAEAARVSAEQLQVASTSVDIDEETVNMLAYQRAYEGTARILSAIDEMLDTLINRTAV